MTQTKNTKSPKLLVVGAARHGKDTFAEILSQEFGMTFESSSQAASDIFIYESLKGKYKYKTPEECFEDRMNHRQEWYELICEYNKYDKARLAKGILERTDCYVGMRDSSEIEECLRQNLFDIVIWVDALKRLPMEDPSSFNIDKSCADIIVENNGTLKSFYDKTIRVGNLIFKK
jgi:dephospho-CoA kinase